MRKGHGAGPGPDGERSGLGSGRALPAAAGPTRGTAPRARPRPPRAAGRVRLGAERRLQLPAGPAAQGGRGGLSLPVPRWHGRRSRGAVGAVTSPREGRTEDARTEGGGPGGAGRGGGRCPGRGAGAGPAAARNRRPPPPSDRSARAPELALGPQPPLAPPPRLRPLRRPVLCGALEGRAQPGRTRRGPEGRRGLAAPRRPNP